MKELKRSCFIYLVIALIVLCAIALPSHSIAAAAEIETVAVEGMPVLGKWMLTSAQEVANWLGQKYQNKAMREPVNMILIVEGVSSPDEAMAKVGEALKTAGFPSRYGHSGGYSAFLGNQICAQQPTQKNHAYSDGSFMSANNHGRIFGPILYAGKYYFSGAFSKETTNLFAFKHIYSSFNSAREVLTAQLIKHSNSKLIAKIDMKNAMPSDSAYTTGDHDGFALVLLISYVNKNGKI
jgi:hypothetical protein